MNLSNKEIREVIQNTAGSGAFPLVKVLKNKKNVSETKLAEHCEMELNEVRSLLYKLHNFNFVFFIKKRNKTTNLYIYYWALDTKNIRNFAVNYKKREIKELKKDLTNENNKKFYNCINGCMRLDFESAYEHNFKCPECNGLLDHEKNNKKIEKIIEKIDYINTTI